MLNMISESEISADARTPFGAGAGLLSAAVVRTAQPRQGSVAFVRPRPHAAWAAAAFGPRLPAAGLGMALGQRNASKQYPNPTTTRIAAASGGAKGPHPEREPVPV
jgi:hypothetical protein